MKKFLKKLLVLAAVVTVGIIAGLSVSNNYSIPQPQQLSLQSKPSWIGLYLSGQHAVRTNDYSKASEFFSESLEARSADPELDSQVLELLIASGQYEKALKLANKVNLTDKSSSAGLLLYADKLKDENYNGAVAALEKLSIEAKSTVIHKILLAWAQLGAKQNTEALATMASLEKQGYFQVLINFNYALIAETAGDDAKAAELYKTLINSTTGKVPAKIAENAYRFFNKTGDEESKKRILESGNKVSNFENQANPPSIRIAAADSLNEVATMLLSEQNFSKATVFFRIGLLINPSNEEALMLLATILAHEKDYNASNEILAAIPEKSQFYFESQMAIAQNYVELKNEISAKNILEELSEVKSIRIEALMTLGDLSRQHEDFAAANKFYTEAIDSIAEYSGSRDKTAYWPLYFARAVTFERLKKWEEAEEDFNKALSLQPNQPDVLNYYAYSLLDMNMESRYAEAKTMLLKALDENPDDTHIIDSIGWAWFKMGDYQKAVKHLEKAASNMPYDPTVNEHLGDVYWKLGRENEARFAWERALKNKPEERFVQELKDKLENGLDYKKAENDITPAGTNITPRVELEVHDSSTR